MGLVLAAGQQALAGALPLPYFLMIALFSFTIFGSVEAINDAAHILSVTDSVLDRLEELEHTDFIVFLPDIRFLLYVPVLLERSLLHLRMPEV